MLKNPLENKRYSKKNGMFLTVIEGTDGIGKSVVDDSGDPSVTHWPTLGKVLAKH